MKTVYLGLEDLLSKDQKLIESSFDRIKFGLSKNELEEMKKEIFSSGRYQETEKEEGAENFIEKMKEFGDVHILASAIEDEFVNSSKAIRKWVEDNFPEIPLTIVPNNEAKSVFATTGYLIDSQMKAVKEFRENRGFAIYHTGSFEESVAYLENFVKNN